MHRRLFFAVSSLVFILAAMLSVISSDLHDRALPQGIHPDISMTLDFSTSNMDDAQALQELADIGERQKLGIVKVMPDLDGDASAQTFVALDSTARQQLPSGKTIKRFGNMPDSRVADSSRLASASANGQYYLLHGNPSDSVVHEWIKRNGISVTWGTDSFRDNTRLLVSQPSFVMSMAAALALIVTMALYWMAVRIRSRALRVLSGVPAWRIQKDDMMGILLPALCAMSLIDVIAIAAIGIAKGFVFVPYFLRMLLLLEGMALVGMIAATLIIGMASWPSTATIMQRTPGNVGLRRSALAMKALVFVAALAVTAPSMSALASADSTAREQRVWERLSDQVSISLSYDDDPQLDSKIADVLRELEHDGKAALSYTFTADMMGETDSMPVALVTRQWLGLMGIDPTQASHTVRASYDRLSSEAKEILSQMTDWSSSPQSGETMIDQAAYYVVDGDTVPVLKGGSDTMLFPDRLTLIVLENYCGFSDSGFLVPAATTRNIVMTGLQDVRDKLQQAGLSQQSQVRYVAEEQILQAQFATYFAWLQAIAFILLAISFALTVMVHAMTRASLRAKHDYPLMLNGFPPIRLAGTAILSETCVAIVATLILTFAALCQSGALAALAVGLLGLFAILVSAFSHILSVNHMFTAINTRTL